MDLPVNWPPGTRFWRLIIDAAADLTTGDFMLLDGSTVSGPRADRLKEQIMQDAVEISEAEFRLLAPPSLLEQLKEIEERAKREPRFAKALRAISNTPGVFEKCEQAAWDCLRGAESPDDVRKSADLLLQITAKKQNIADQ